MNRRLVALVLGALVFVGSAVRGETVEGLAAQPVLVEAGEDVPPLPRVRALTHGAAVRNVSYSPDSATLASFDKTVRLWEAPSGRESRTLKGHSDAVSGVSFSSDGVTLTSFDKTVGLWEVASGREIRTFTDHTSSVSGVSFSPDGVTLASASDDNTVRLWQIASGRESRTLTGHSDVVLGVSFRPATMHQQAFSRLPEYNLVLAVDKALAEFEKIDKTAAGKFTRLWLYKRLGGSMASPDPHPTESDVRN